MTRDRLIHSESYTIRSYEADLKKQVRLSTLIRYMQETAWHHADALEVGYDDLIADGLIWVLIRLSVKINLYPVLGDNITLYSWPSTKDRLFYMRDFEIRNARGEIIASAITSWLVMDAQKRRPASADFISDLHCKEFKRSLPEDPAKLPKLSSPEPSYEMTVKYADLDVNAHVNNARFIDFMINGIPIHLFEQRDIEFFEINIIQEAFHNDRLAVFTQKEDDHTLLLSLTRMSDNADISRARLVFKNKEGEGM